MAADDLVKFIDDLPVAISFRDALEPSECVFGDDRDAPVGLDDADLGWKGEIIDGYPIRERSVEEIRKSRKKAEARMRFDAQVRREVAHVPPGAESVRTYVARIRTAMRQRIASDEMHARFYDGRRPHGGAEALDEMGLHREAIYVRTATVEIGGEKVQVLPARLHHEDRRVEIEPSDPRDTVTEGRLRGREAGSARRDAHARSAELFVTATDVASDFLQNDKLKFDGGTDTGTVEEVQSDGKVKVRRDQGGEVVVDKPAADSGAIQRVAVKITADRIDFSSPVDRAAVVAAANQALHEHPQSPKLDVGSDIQTLVAWLRYNDPNGEYEWEPRIEEPFDSENGASWFENEERGDPLTVDQAWHLIEDQVEDYMAPEQVKTAAGMTHAPKGVHSVGDPEEGIVVQKDADVTNKKNPLHLQDDDTDNAKIAALRPIDEVTAILRWPNLTALSAAIPKLAAKDWIAGIGREVVRHAGTCTLDQGAFEFEARFPSQETARKFATVLVKDFHVRPTAIEASTVREDGGGRFMQVAARGAVTAYVHVDMARRVILPGGIVFALEGNINPGQFQLGEHVLVMDPMSQSLAEGILAAIGPEVAVVTASDGTQYEYGRGSLRRLTLAMLDLADADVRIFPAGQRVLVAVMEGGVGRVEGTLMGIDGAIVRVLFDDGPRRVPRERVAAIVSVADLD